jgi:hypothetical protein
LVFTEVAEGKNILGKASILTKALEKRGVTVEN